MDEINNNMIQLYASLNKLSLNRMIEKVSNLKKNTYHKNTNEIKSEVFMLLSKYISEQRKLWRQKRDIT